MEQQRQQELRRLFHMLEHTAKLAEESALTGAFKNGETRCIAQFNNVLARLSDLGAVPQGLFDRLHAEASFNEIGIACHQLAAYLNDELDTTHDFKGWVTSFFGKRFVESVEEKLKDGQIGDLIRKSAPDFLTESTLEDIAETFPVAPGGRLTVDAALGVIDIQGADSDTVAVRILRSAQWKADRRAGEILKNFDVQIKHEPPDVKIEAQFKGTPKQRKKANARLDIHFDIIVPRHYDVDLKTSGDDISVANLEGDVNAKTSGGRLRLENITGPIDGHTSGGNIELNGFKGATSLRTSGGNIKVQAGTGDVTVKTSGGELHCVEVTGAIIGKTTGGNITLTYCKGGADVNTAGGSINLENDGPVQAKATGGSIRSRMLGQLRGDCVLETTGGSIDVSLRPDIAVAIDAKALGGTVQTEFPVTVEVAGVIKPGQLQGTLNGGGPLLKLRGLGGNITLKQAKESNEAAV